MTILWSLLGVFILVGANGFFVAAEFALVSVRKTRIDQLASEGVSAARYVKRAIEDLDRYIAGTQVGITIASLALGWIGEPAVVKILAPVFDALTPDISESLEHGIAIAVSFTLITFLHVIIGELVPKSLALNYSEKTSLYIARPMSLVITLFKPLIWSLNGLGQLLLGAMGMKGAHDHDSVHSPTELLLLIGQSHAAGQLDSFERSMLQKTFRFSETPVSEVMTPRSRVDALDLKLKDADILKAAAASPYSRLPAFRESVDEIVGVVFTHDLFKFALHQVSGRTLQELVRPLMYVPESCRLDDLVVRFQQERTQMAVVIDEYGGTAGIITLEDVIETVFGEVQDGNEDPTSEIEILADTSIILRGDTRLQDLNDRFGWNLIDDASTTIAGYVMTAMGRLPQLGDKLSSIYGTFEVIEKKKHRVTKIKLHR